jgi:hypothetical protein
MDRQFNKQDFEKLLRENANQYRMYPTEKVWNGVHAALHTRRKWYRISALALLLFSATSISLLVLNYSTDKKIMTELEKTSPAKNAPLSVSKLLLENNSSDYITPEISIKDNQILASRDQKIVSVKKSVPDNIIVTAEKISYSPEIVQPEITSNSELVEMIIQNENEELISEIKVPDNTAVEKLTNNNLISEESQKINIDSKTEEAVNALASLQVPLITNPKRSGITAQFYITPTVSYRKLTENKSPYATNTTYNYRYLDVNNIVNHKPAMGMEFGVEGKYKLNERVSLKSGLQFNINRYDIRAYSSPTEIATVAVSSGYRTSMVSSLSNYRNFSGYTPNWLENFYFQAALPIGAELILFERKNVSWGVSGTIQPTYVIGDKAYMISSDYKNYAEFPDLMRRWNISTGFETFVSYSTGKIKWQTGPHVRYQHLSSYVSGYPVKENLFAIGLKIAATFNKK